MFFFHSLFETEYIKITFIAYYSQKLPGDENESKKNELLSKICLLLSISFYSVKANFVYSGLKANRRERERETKINHFQLGRIGNELLSSFLIRTFSYFFFLTLINRTTHFVKGRKKKSKKTKPNRTCFSESSGLCE